MILATRIVVIGTPGPQGSKRAFINRHTGKAALTEMSSKVKPWREAVKWAALEAVPPGSQFSGPVACEMIFSLARPKSAPKRVILPAKRPDLDKLIRSTGDAITSAGVWEDDSNVVEIRARKVFAGSSDCDALAVPGCVIHVRQA